ncbi:MAG: hypothetical protein K5648_09175 [Erysipelotrichaceae bacterium]|nr:hypothetical protein [Erysipelotrichaceae bacterium]
MNPKIIYPIPERLSSFYKTLRNIARIVFIAAALICFLVNYLTKGKVWSIIVAWSLFSLWRLVFSLRLVEFSIYSHANKVTFYIVVLLILIDRFLSSGWAETVIPIVLFADLLVMFILFFALYDRKDRHLISVVLLGLFNLISIPYSIHSWPIENWIAFSFQIASMALFIVMLVANRKELVYEIKARFATNTK